MTEPELDKLADKIVERMEHKACLLNLNAEDAQCVKMWSNAHRQVPVNESVLVWLLRLGKEADGWAVRIIRYAVLALLVLILILFGRMGYDNFSSWGR